MTTGKQAMTNKMNISAVDLQKIIQNDVDAIKEVIADRESVVIGLPYWHEFDSNGSIGIFRMLKI